MFNRPLAYFISFRTYGTWLHGDERGSVDRLNNQYGALKIKALPALDRFEAAELHQRPVILDGAQRGCIDDSVRAVCVHKGWRLHAINVRSNHVHVVVTAPSAPEVVLNAFKAWATRRLREAGFVGHEQRVWSRHGSTVYLFTTEKLAEKIRYVLEEQ